MVFYDSENKSILILFDRYEEGPPDPADPKGMYGAILNPDLSFRKRPVFVQKTETGAGFTFGPFVSDAKIHEPTGKLLLGQSLMTPWTWESECFVAQVDRTLQNPTTVLSLDNTSTEFALLGFTGSEIETAQFWLQRANAKGKAVGQAIEIDSGVDCVHGGVITALPSAPSVGHLYAVFYIEGERDQPPLDNQGSGLVFLRVNTAP